jgi:hypothetical protein
MMIGIGMPISQSSAPLNIVVSGGLVSPWINVKALDSFRSE